MRNSIEVARYIEGVLNEIKMKPAELANRIGVDRSTVSRYLKGTRKISMEDIPKIASAIGVSPIELLIEEESKSVIKEPTNIYHVSQETVQIPVLGPIACGDPILAEANYEEYRTELKDGLPSGDLFFLKAKGDSMTPTVPDGSLVLIRHQKDVENGEIAAVTLNGHTEATLKRVKKQGDVIMLVPENNNHEIIIVSKDNPAEIIGKAVEIRTQL